MNKPPAKTEAPAKPAAKTASTGVAKPTPAAKAATKTAAKTAATTAAKTAAPTAAKTPAPVTVKAAAPAVVKATAPGAVKSAAPGTVKAAAPAAAKAAAPAAVKTPASKASAKKAAMAAPAPIPAPAPMANRFTDRFAPAAKPAARQMTETAELPKPIQKIDPKLANAWKGKPGRDLTEPELLAMPESEYMNDKQLDFFRVRLQQQKDDLLSSAGETTEHLREDTSIVPDPVDRATIEEEHALELRTRDRERKLLKKIAQSLTRLETGEYGFCDETGEPIGLARLMARPTATLSLEAQQRREMKQKMFGD